MYFTGKIKNVNAVKLVHNLGQNEIEKDINIQRAGEWISGLTFWINFILKEIVQNI